MRQTHTFVLKILLDNQATSRLHGQISQPSSDDEWRASFGDVNELLRQLVTRVSAAPGEMEIELALKRVEPNGMNERSHK
ncbi:MAG: hypothetical protein B6D41_01770 [Chloroflexi bacterium UTCFX4]|jgi:hypothetical protein|nr:MAG: hypothetical protein B6D41_01770 [Chloroflexi bacterium UTCFX4]